MWFPSWGYMFWPESNNNSKSFELSKTDSTDRDFEVSLFLEELNGRKVQTSTLKIAEHYTTDLIVSGEKLPVLFAKRELDGDPRSMTVSKEKDGRVGTIVTKVKTKSMIDAVRMAYNSHAHLLSFLSLMNGANLPIFAIKVTDTKHNISWSAKPQEHAPDEFQLPAGLGFGDKFKVLLSLYREGKNNPSPYYRFLCFYKILEAFYEHRNVFSEIDTIIREKGLNLKRPKRKITNQHILYALCKHPEFEGLSFGTFFEKIRSDHRLRVAHVFPEIGSVNLDDFDLYTEFNEIGNLTDQIARQILLDEIDLWQQLITVGAV